MAYEVEIHDGATVYMLPSPSYPDGYDETIEYNAASRVLANGAVAIQTLSYQQIVAFKFKWTAVSVSEIATFANVFNAISQRTCTLIAPTGITYTVTVDPDDKQLRKRIYKAKGALVFDVEMSMRALY